jgi:hypothetical protein
MTMSHSATQESKQTDPETIYYLIFQHDTDEAAIFLTRGVVLPNESCQSLESVGKSATVFVA